jgi:dTDP-4-amino-4,6-dideoxygalactose transaminase
VLLTKELADRRRAIFESLRERGIGVNVHYIPVHTQSYYRELGFARGDFPCAEDYYARAISIPLFPALSREQQDKVVAELRSALT